MTKNNSFELIWKREVKELESVATFWKHRKSGAELLSFANNDENKVFGVSFRTPPTNSTGVAHILEHSVLNGSKKYPSKEPFVELLKGSLQTFLNAFTYPDKTCYPVASANLQDFYNLVSVYLDAVFHPLITKHTFWQEGWHISAPSKEEPLTYKGVVYNEMKGVYSSPDSVLSESSQQSIFPDITYGLDSGGHPKEILKLTYEDFCGFHSTFYHPSNARFFFWGDDSEEKRLEILDGVLQNFESTNVPSNVSLQKPLARPKLIEVPYASGEEEGATGMVTMNWLLPETENVFDNFALQVLDHILTGLPGSPLRRALIESGFGEDIAGSGLENELRQMYYSIGLRGINEENVPQIELLIMETLAELAEDGVPVEAVAAALNTLEFDLRENNTGRFPVGLAIMLRSLTTWLYNKDPLELVAFESPLAQLKQKIANGEKVFEEMIKKYFLENQHYSTVVLVPDKNLASKNAKEEEDELAAIKKALSASELDELTARSAELKSIQEREEDPAAIAAIPHLTLNDLPRENRIIPREELVLGEVPLIFHPQPTTGIVYVDLLFNILGVEEKLLPMLPLFGRAMLEMGTKKRSFVEMGALIAAKTGGIEADPVFLTTKQRDTLPGFMVSGKATKDKVGELCELLQEILQESNFNDEDRFWQIVLEEKARQEQELIPAGHSMVALRLQSILSQTGSMSEKTNGIEYLDFLRDLASKATTGWADVKKDLESIRAACLARGNLVINLTCQEKELEPVKNSLQKLIAGLPLVEKSPAPTAVLPCSSFAAKNQRQNRGEALVLPAQVNYVGQGINLYDLGYEYHASIHVILKYLRTGYLWEEVRVKGGAYGAICSFDRMSGAFCLVSYRDPNVENTINVYGRAGEHLKNLKLDNGELTRSIIGAIGELDTYLLPDAKGMASFTRYLANDTDETRAIMRSQILSTKIEDFKAFGEVLAKIKDGYTCILGGEEAAAYAKTHTLTSRKA